MDKIGQNSANARPGVLEYGKSPSQANFLPQFIKSDKTPGRAFSLESARGFRKLAITLSTGLRLRRARYSRKPHSKTKELVVFNEHLDVISTGQLLFESSCN